MNALPRPTSTATSSSSLLLLAVVVAGSMLGCGSGFTGVRSFDAQILGVFSEKPRQKTAQRLGKFEDVFINEKALTVPVYKGATVATSEVVAMQVKRKTYERDEDFTLVLGGPFEQPSVMGKGEFNYRGEFRLLVGWVFLWGQAPMARTQWGAAGADGTTIAIQALNDEHRYYYVKARPGNSPCKVYVSRSAQDPPVILTDAGQFAVINADGGIDGPKNIADDEAAAKFIGDASDLAEGAGWIR